jgi:hypothetical protein
MAGPETFGFDGAPINSVDALGLSCRRDNFLKKISSGELRDAKEFNNIPGTSGHARSKHGVKFDDPRLLDTLNQPDRVFTGFSERGRPLDVYYKGGNVAFTEAGDKTSVVTAYGPMAAKNGNEPFRVEKLENPSGWRNQERWAEVKASQGAPTTVIYPSQKDWQEDWHK